MEIQEMIENIKTTQQKRKELFEKFREMAKAAAENKKSN